MAGKSSVLSKNFLRIYTGSRVLAVSLSGD